MQPHARAAAVLELVGVLAALATVLSFRDAVVDDAFIGLRHADNLLRGEGLVWNAGERVEGITNLAFVLATAGLGALGIDLLVAARALGMLGAALAVWLGPAALLPGPDSRLPRAVARLLLCSNFAFVYLAWTGLETGLFTGLVAATAYRLARDDLRVSGTAGLLAGLAFAVRPDGALVAVVAVALAGWRHGARAVVRSAGPWVFAAIVAAVEAFRLAYYGALVPNPARVKGVLSQAADSGVPWYGGAGDDLVEFLSGTGGPLAAVLVAIAIFAARDRDRTRLGVAICAAYTAFEIYSGGDWMLGYRYMQPMLPAWLSLVAAGLAIAARPLLATLRGRLVALAAVLLVAGHAWSDALRFRQDARHYPHFVMTSTDMIAAARWIGEHYPPGARITAWRIGALGYHAPLHVIDTNGLTDREVADRMRDPAALDAYLAAQRPDLALKRGRPGEPAEPKKALYGAIYVHVRDFPQGEHQTWQLYARMP